MTDKTKLALVKAFHTIIYLIMAAATLFIFYAGIAKYRGPLLTVSLVLTAIEAVVFIGNGRKCPLTALAQKYGAVKGYAFDTFLPEKWTKYTFRFFGTILVIGLALILRGLAAISLSAQQATELGQIALLPLTSAPRQ